MVKEMDSEQIKFVLEIIKAASDYFKKVPDTADCM